jgi:hypothetical protein
MGSTGDKVKGKANELIGKATGDKSQEVKGKGQQAKGGAKDKLATGLDPDPDPSIEAYAYARVGYHRGLDALRGRGWGGTGFVRWSQPSNRPFLTCLVRLRNAAAQIGELPEVQRIDEFLVQLDPDWDDANVPS